MDYIIETHDISKIYGDFTAVRFINLKVPRTGIYGF